MPKKVSRKRAPLVLPQIVKPRWPVQGHGGKPRTAVITGVSGFLGSTLGARFLMAHAGNSLRAVVRPKKGKSVKEREREICLLLAFHMVCHEGVRRKRSLGFKEKIEQTADLIQGQITFVEGFTDRPDFGLPLLQFNELASGITDVINAAASINFYEPLNEAIANNKISAENFIKLVKEAKSNKGFHIGAHISTAYAAGGTLLSTGRIILETELPLEKNIGDAENLPDLLGRRLRTKEFFNVYEQTKAWAELLIRRTQTRREAEVEHHERMIEAQLPIMVLKPSIIVGHSQSGWTPSFDPVVYPAFYMIWRNKLSALSVKSGYSRLDVVPLDFVSAAIQHLQIHAPLDKVLGNTFHLTSHPNDHLLIEDLVGACKLHYQELTEDSDKPFKPKPTGLLTHGRARILRNADSIREKLPGQKPVDQKVKNQRQTVFDYSKIGGHPFDTTQAQAILEPKGISPPHLSDYLREILQFCVDHHWRTPSIFTHDIIKKVAALPEKPRGSRSVRKSSKRKKGSEKD